MAGLVNIQVMYTTRIRNIYTQAALGTIFVNNCPHLGGARLIYPAKYLNKRLEVLVPKILRGLLQQHVQLALLAVTFGL